MTTPHVSSHLVIKDETPAAPEQRLVYAEVYAPMRPDSHGDFMSAEEIQKMAHRFSTKSRLQNVDQDHDNTTTPGVQIVETFIARKGDPDFLEGSWVVGIHIPDDDTWARVKSGELNGLSMEALVLRESREVELTIPPVVTGDTSKNADHSHRFYVTYKDGVFQGGVTDEVNGHKHYIRGGTVTDETEGHTHTFSSVDDIKIEA
jgi:hypothetical protein